MAVNKTSRTIAGTAHNLFTIQADDVRRALGIGTTWNQLRIGCRFSYAADPGASQVSAQVVAFGLQKAAGTSYGEITPSGNRQILLKCQPWVRASGPPVTFSSPGTGDTVIVSIRGATTDVSGSSASSTNLVVSADLNYLNALILDITRGVTDWQAVAIMPTSVTPTHCTSAQLRAAITALDTAAAIAELPAGYTAITKMLTGETARVGTYGDFDEIVFSAKTQGGGIIVGDFMVYRVS